MVSDFALYLRHISPMWGEDTSKEAECLRPKYTAPKAVKERLGLWEGLAFSVSVDLHVRSNGVLGEDRQSRMCGRYTLRSRGNAKFYGVPASELPFLVPRYNIAPSQDVPVIL